MSEDGCVHMCMYVYVCWWVCVMVCGSGCVYVVGGHLVSGVCVCASWCVAVFMCVYVNLYAHNSTVRELTN